jgi:hypothetical protein
VAAHQRHVVFFFVARVGDQELGVEFHGGVRGEGARARILPALRDECLSGI